MARRAMTDEEQKEAISILAFMDDGCQCYDFLGKRKVVHGARADYPFTCLACRARAVLKATDPDYRSRP